MLATRWGGMGEMGRGDWHSPVVLPYCRRVGVYFDFLGLGILVISKFRFRASEMFIRDLILSSLPAWV